MNYCSFRIYLEHTKCKIKNCTKSCMIVFIRLIKRLVVNWLSIQKLKEKIVC